MRAGRLDCAGERNIHQAAHRPNISGVMQQPPSLAGYAQIKDRGVCDGFKGEYMLRQIFHETIFLHIWRGGEVNPFKDMGGIRAGV